MPTQNITKTIEPECRLLPVKKRTPEETKIKSPKFNIFLKILDFIFLFIAEKAKNEGMHIIALIINMPTINITAPVFKLNLYKTNHPFFILCKYNFKSFLNYTLYIVHCFNC